MARLYVYNKYYSIGPYYDPVYKAHAVRHERTSDTIQWMNTTYSFTNADGFHVDHYAVTWNFIDYDKTYYRLASNFGIAASDYGPILYRYDIEKYGSTQWDYYVYEIGTCTQGYKCGSYIGEVIAEEGTRPNNGRYSSDGYWYIKQGIHSGVLANVNGVWKPSTVYAKQNGVWTESNTYANVNGEWKY